jgi:hypothetical protein
MYFPLLELRESSSSNETDIVNRVNNYTRWKVKKNANGKMIDIV